jgi:AcrR family transcriptional regulator
MLSLQFLTGMENTGTLSEKGIKEQLIIEAAQKRFGQFGVEKTSMREIADDLNLSKAFLYYYFPDKENLYRAVVIKEQSEFIERILRNCSEIHEPDQMLREYASSRLSYFRTLLNLGRLRSEIYSNLKPVLKETIEDFRQKEKEIIENIIRKGISGGIFFSNDPEQAALLFLDLLKGLRITILYDKKSLVIDQQEYDRLLDKTNAFADLFIRSLRFH